MVLFYYKEVNGNCDVPSEWKEDPQLGSWMGKQRYRRKRGLLTEERVRKLDDVGCGGDDNEKQSFDDSASALYYLRNIEGFKEFSS